MKPRMIVWFSCGACSAVAAHEAIARCSDSHAVQIVCCDTRPSEHPDNYRFSDDVVRWIGMGITYIRNEGFETVDDVFDRTRYMAGIAGARCTTELKKIPRLAFQRPDDVHVFGFAADEQNRVREFESRNPELFLRWLLVEAELTKQDCINTVRMAGIELPAMYKLGFDNNNCPGCVKASSPWYWSMIRKHFPDVFQRRAEQSRALGVRLVEIHHHERIFLDELPDRQFQKIGEQLSCGPECGIQTKLLL